MCYCTVLFLFPMLYDIPNPKKEILSALSQFAFNETAFLKRFLLKQKKAIRLYFFNPVITFLLAYCWLWTVIHTLMLRTFLNCFCFTVLFTLWICSAPIIYRNVTVVKCIVLLSERYQLTILFFYSLHCCLFFKVLSFRRIG